MSLVIQGHIRYMKRVALGGNKCFSFNQSLLMCDIIFII